MRAKALLFVLELYSDGCCGGDGTVEREREMEALEIDKGKEEK